MSAQSSSLEARLLQLNKLSQDLVYLIKNDCKSERLITKEFRRGLKFCSSKIQNTLAKRKEHGVVPKPTPQQEQQIQKLIDLMWELTEMVFNLLNKNRLTRALRSISLRKELDYKSFTIFEKVSSLMDLLLASTPLPPNEDDDEEEEEDFGRRQGTAAGRSQVLFKISVEKESKDACKDEVSTRKNSEPKLIPQTQCCVPGGTFLHFSPPFLSSIPQQHNFSPSPLPLLAPSPLHSQGISEKLGTAPTNASLDTLCYSTTVPSTSSSLFAFSPPSSDLLPSSSPVTSPSLLSSLSISPYCSLSSHQGEGSASRSVFSPCMSPSSVSPNSQTVPFLLTGGTCSVSPLPPVAPVTYGPLGVTTNEETQKKQETSSSDNQRPVTYKKELQPNSVYRVYAPLAFLSSPYIQQEVSLDQKPSQNQYKWQNMEANHLWESIALNSQERFAVTWKQFIQHFKSKCGSGNTFSNADKRALRYLLDCGQIGIVSAYRFEEFLKGFGPFDRCLDNMRKVICSSWFHGFLSHSDTRLLLSHQTPGAWLVRFSESNPGSFVLAVALKTGQVLQVIIESQQPLGYKVKLTETSEKVFKSLSDIFEVFKDHMGQPYSSDFIGKSWFHGDLTPAESEDLLGRESEGTFLVRFAEDQELKAEQHKRRSSTPQEASPLAISFLTKQKDHPQQQQGPNSNRLVVDHAIVEWLKKESGGPDGSMHCMCRKLSGHRVWSSLEELVASHQRLLRMPLPNARTGLYAVKALYRRG